MARITNPIEEIVEIEDDPIIEKEGDRQQTMSNIFYAQSSALQNTSDACMIQNEFSKIFDSQ